jgi:hypothetical protein
MPEDESFTLARAMTADALVAYQAIERAACTCDPDGGLDLCGWGEWWWPTA